MATKPVVRPRVPHFSSGPCAKRPGWTPLNLKDAALGRSHRAKVGRAKLKLAIDLTREILEVPKDYRIGIVPASDTGAVEMALWSLLGERKVTMLAWESFGEGWVSDVAKELKLKRIVCISEDFAFGHEQMGAFQRVFEDNGGKIVQKLWTPLNAPDYGTYISQLKPNLDAVYTGHAGSNGFKIAGTPGVTLSPLRVKSPLMKMKDSGGFSRSFITSVVTGLGCRFSNFANF